MALTSQIGNFGSNISPEQRQLKAERNRVQSYINSYTRNPDNWTQSMLQQLEMMAMQYQIPFKRQIQEAGALKQMGAALGGLADSAAFGFIPDKWYSDESTRVGANIGKIGGAAAQIAAAVAATVATGGAAAPTIGKAAASLGTAIKGARGLKGAADIAKAAGTLGATTIAKGGVGRLTSGAIQTGKQTLAPYGAKQGWNWAKNTVKSQNLKKSEDVFNAASSAIKNTDNLAKVVKGKELTPGQITMLTNQITKKYGAKSKVTKNFLDQLKQSKSVGELKGVEPKHLIDMANSLNKNWNVNSANVKSLLKKSGADTSASNVKYIVDKLKEENITKLGDDAVNLIIKLARSGQADDVAIGLADIDKWGALSTLGMGAGAALSLTDYTPSREDLMKQEDPYDPYNL